ncbi:N-acetyl-gamma-glutamyl-phosphate reductase [Marinobacterium aestuariivivens]|uniref:N-acetyl-gamma-glutamyl-phosphate reductase n=1 Tax=Marinobacterium aestuariivivens TaxID=1698799 RepID=A0ABW2A015_9GAMM
MIKVGIVGGTGYTGVELLRILANHPDVKVDVITSRSEEGIRVADMFPNLRGHFDLAFTVPDVDRLATCDAVFFATPHGVAMSMAPELVERGVKVIDLGADFRIKDLELWSRWYGMEHTAPALAAEAVYGLPEVNREQIRSARMIACPGCYPTAVQLGYLPLVENGLIDHRRLIADCKSGVSGAGRGASVGTLLCETSESFKAYGAAGHRHLPEIKQGLSAAAGRPVGLTFVPHLTPMIRGIHATLYGVLKDPTDGLQALFEERYADEPFVDVMPAGSHPETRSVKGANYCRISIFRPQDDDTVVVLSVIDNLVKGAAGQAVQNLNILFGLDERAGLNLVGLMP